MLISNVCGVAFAEDSLLSKLQQDKSHHTESGFTNPYLDLEPSVVAFLKTRYFGDLSWPDEPVNYRKFWQKADLQKIDNPSEKPQATLIGHSTVLLQYQGLNILTDPIFSERAFPVQFAGPKRYTPVAIKLEDLPEIDLVVISHNHYDHLDKDTVKALGDKPLWLVPLGLKSWFTSLGIDNVQELDWWSEYRFKGLTLQFQPNQHWSRRGLFDTNKSLWGAWAFIWPDFTAWFGGDTGYNDVQFKQIGQVLGEVDLAMIPIGAYQPRWFMKYQHINPDEAVKIFQDINAKSAFGIHWNTFVLTAEAIDQPPVDLKKALVKNNLSVDSFRAMPLGETYQSN
ncbi:MBL fold metallo-hydrolase [Pelagibaculum spongiae]|uniref:MBL fold metallo-hydrolase n=1 Tax=Pelagibaculum spongiae TaxID=2080658 RepID=UPI001314FF1E|nr:MBL fold metallo-hydrolase [Pelagibaculum spongiae]